MKAPLLLSIITFVTLAWLPGCGSSDLAPDDGAGTATGAATASDHDSIKKAAKSALRDVMKLDDKKKFTSMSSKDASNKVCNELIVHVTADGAIKHSKDLKQLVVHVVGGDVGDMQKAAKKLCSVAVSGLGADCQLDQAKVHAFGKNDCDLDKVYVGVIGETKDAEDAIEEHHHFDEWKNGALRLDGKDDSEDDLFSDDDGGQFPIEIVGD